MYKGLIAGQYLSSVTGVQQLPDEAEVMAQTLLGFERLVPGKPSQAITETFHGQIYSHPPGQQEQLL